jgi:hypothetical protein
MFGMEETHQKGVQLLFQLIMKIQVDGLIFIN